ncbi:hypothetical protein ACLKA7_016688 [Drosophila subpalustris]
MSSASTAVAVAVPACSSNYVSTLDLTKSEPGDQKEGTPAGASSGSKVLRFIWHTLYNKYSYFCTRSQTLKQLVCREANKPLPKKFRHTMRLNKSAKRKGYEFYMSDEDRRRLDEYTFRNSELSARIGIPYEYRPAFS